ncbi:Uu.00g051650.m01.CDS01 [Anthostomella pinea]|uniref:Uu.00g051650.m01.CDS01 n=1 Tax=Anthostomella pinea TaxID=933095 RepID=A0AAI8VX11_9PEZI|nr:Uu.00g051650.m01.CDS01 [Anthostomella pinea]
MSSSHVPPPPSSSSYGSGGRGMDKRAAPGPSPAVNDAVLTPTSASTIYTSPDSSHHHQYIVAKSEPDDGASSAGSSVTADASYSGPAKKKQKRNKPTLSCHECVERKTKASAVPFHSFIST